MRILLLAPQPFFQLRGTPIAVRRVCEVLAAQGHTVDLLTLHEGSDVEIPGCTIHRVGRPPFVDHVPPGFSVAKVLCEVGLFAKAMGLCRAHDYDIVHAVEDSVFVAMALKALYGVPFVFDMDSSMPDQLQDKYPFLASVIRPLRWAERRAIRSSRGVVVVCKALEDIARSAAPNAPIVRVEDTSPVPLLTGPAPSDVDWTQGPTVLYVGNLEPYQGVELLLRGFAARKASDRAAQLVIVGGSDTHIAEHRALARELGIASTTHFLGPRPLEAVGAYLTAATVVVSPRTQGQNTPMKVFSYLESGTPLVATRLSTHTQVLDDDTALLAEASVEGMAAALTEVLSNPVEAHARAQHGLHRMKTEFDRATLDARLVSFYESVLGEPRQEASAALEPAQALTS